MNVEPRCQCNDGYMRREDGKCVRCTDKKFCGENEKFYACATCSEESCADGKICADCGPNQTNCCLEENTCQCKNGFARNEEGKCVDRKECADGPSTCGSNEKWHECPICDELVCGGGTAMICNQSPCVNEIPLKPECCIAEARCQCRVGLMRNSRGFCVKPDHKSCEVERKIVSLNYYRRHLLPGRHTFI